MAESGGHTQDDAVLRGSQASDAVFLACCGGAIARLSSRARTHVEGSQFTRSSWREHRESTGTGFSALPAVSGSVGGLRRGKPAVLGDPLLGGGADPLQHRVELARALGRADPPVAEHALHPHLLAGGKAVRAPAARHQPRPARRLCPVQRQLPGDHIDERVLGRVRQRGRGVVRDRRDSGRLGVYPAACAPTTAFLIPPDRPTYTSPKRSTRKLYPMSFQPLPLR